MIPMTLAQIAQAVGGTLHDVDDPSATVSGTVEFDSRKITPGGCSWRCPVRGWTATTTRPVRSRPVRSRVLAAASRRGSRDRRRAARHVGQRALALEHDRDGSGPRWCWRVGKLARASHVDRLTTESGLTVVGVRGSSGKTSTKDLLPAVLSPLGSVVAPPGRSTTNWDIRGPRCAPRRRHRFLVLRCPRAAVATSRRSRRSHHPVSEWSSTSVPRISASSARARRSRRPRAKLPASLPCPRPTGGVAVLNADDPLVAAMADRTEARVVMVGLCGQRRRPRHRRAPRRPGARELHADVRGPGPVPVTLAVTASTPSATRSRRPPSHSSAVRPSIRSLRPSAARRPCRPAAWRSGTGPMA